MLVGHQKFGKWADVMGVSLSREMHMTDDAGRFTSISHLRQLHDLGELRGHGYLPLHEGKTIHQFSDQWDTPPRYAVRIAELAEKPQTAGARATTGRPVAKLPDRRTTAPRLRRCCRQGCCAVTPSTSSAHRRRRSNAAALSLVGVMNSFPFDWLLRQKAAAHVSLYILLELPAPQLDPDADRLLAHAALRLCCNHRGFAPLWREQLGVAWEEASPRRSWPVIAVEADRWRLRAAMDASSPMHTAGSRAV